MHGHTEGPVGGGHLPSVHHQPHQFHHPSAHPSDVWNAPPAPGNGQLLRNLASGLIRNPRAISALIVLTITVILLVLFTF